jgi:hypothetical protein
MVRAGHRHRGHRRDTEPRLHQAERGRHVLGLMDRLRRLRNTQQRRVDIVEQFANVPLEVATDRL